MPALGLTVDDRSLLAAFRQGKTEAFESIVRRHHPRLLRIAERRCGGGALAEDAVQIAFVRAHRYLRTTGPIENLGAWLRRIVHNCANDLLRTERRDRLGLDAVGEVAAPDQAAGDDKELRGIIAQGIERLPEIYREPLRLCYLHGLKAREISIRLDENLHSVKSRIARGRAELRRRLRGTLERGGWL